MASLIEGLTEVLEEQLNCYKALLNLSIQKTDIIVNNDVPSLQKVTEEEQNLAGRIFRLEKKRDGIIEDIALVINQPKATLTLKRLIELLGKDIKEQQKLLDLSNTLSEILGNLKDRNEQNKKLITQSLEMINFTVNAIQGSKMAPETASYANKGNANTGKMNSNIFDAKQ